MALSVGIHDKLILNKVLVNDKGTLIINLKEAGTIDPLAALNGSGDRTDFEQKEQDFFFYPMKATNNKGDLHPYNVIMKLIAEVKDPLNHILLRYTSSGNIKWDLFAGMNVTAENITTLVTQQSNLDLIYKNIVNQFLKMVKPFIGETVEPSRWIFPRSSEAKHYPAIRRRFLDSQPFIEPSSILKEQSKLKFSDYEIEKKLHTGERVTAPQEIDKKEAAQADALFSNQ